MYSSCGEVFNGMEVNYLFTIFRCGVGCGTLIGPSLAGLLYDSFGSYHNIFFINGGVYLVTCFLYISIILMNRLKPNCVFPEQVATN